MFVLLILLIKLLVFLMYKLLIVTNRENNILTENIAMLPGQFPSQK